MITLDGISKVCNRCKQSHGVELFGADNSRKDRLNPRCQACVREVSSAYSKRTGARAQRAWAKRNTAHLTHYAKHAAAERARSAAKYQKNRPWYQAWHAQDRATYPEKYRAQQRAWAATAHGKLLVKLKQGRRRAQTAAPVAEEAVVTLIQRFAGLCAWCASRPADTLDHVMPLAKGGAHSITNLVPACKSCNSRKRDMLPEAWATKIGVNLQAVFDKARAL